MTRRIAALLLVLLLTLSSSITRSKAQPSFNIIGSTWGSQASPLEAEPGDKNMALTITMQYAASSAVSRLAVTLHPPSGFTDSNGADHPKAYSAGLQPGSIFQVSFSLDIAAGVALGSHIFSAQITWTRVDNSNDEEYVPVTVRLRGRVALAFQPSDTSLVPGQVNTLTMVVTNRGTGGATEVSISLAAPPQTSILTEMPTQFSLSAGQSRDVAVNVFVSAMAAGSALSFAASATYKDAYLNPRSTAQNVGLFVSPIGQASITVAASMDSLQSGETSTVDLTVQNRGTFSLGNLSATVTPQPPISLTDSDGRFIIGTLGAGKSTSIRARMFVAPTAGPTGSVTVALTYVDYSQTVRSEARTLSFLLVPRISSPLSVSLSSTSLRANSQLNITVKIANNGSAVRNMTVAVTLTGPQTSIVGPGVFQMREIPAGGNSSFDLPVFTGSVATASSAALALTASYLDSSGVQRGDSWSFGLTIEVAPTSSSLAISIRPDILRTGTVNNLTMTLHNVGQVGVNTLSATFSFPSGAATLLEPDIYQVSTIGSDESVTADLKVYASSTAAASVLLQVSLKYYDERQVITQETR